MASSRLDERCNCFCTVLHCNLAISLTNCGEECPSILAIDWSLCGLNVRKCVTVDLRRLKSLRSCNAKTMREGH